jgi:YVTN family beta-propeller protein
VGLALSPTGAKLFVAELAESRVSVINTATMTAGASQKVKNPRGIAVTNNADLNDADETVVVTEFFGEQTAPANEATDISRRGRVRMFKASDLSPDGNIGFDPVDSNILTAGVGHKTSPNQLWAVAIQGGRIYIPSVAASPAPPLRFDNNVFPLMLVGNLTAKAADTTASGTTNLMAKIRTLIPMPTVMTPRFALGDIVDLSFVPGTNISYVVSRAAEVVQRVVWDPAAAADADKVKLGSTQNLQIDVNVAVGAGVCQNPTGIVVKDSTTAYVNCWATKRLGVLDLGSQSLKTTVKSTDPIAADTVAVQRGRHFYFTGRGRWSKDLVQGEAGTKGGEGYSGCGSCHPDGLSDNITWAFGAGPRQTTSQDGSFSHGAGGTQKQRIFNFTSIFDEHYDFERNTRDVSGGLGVITKAATAADCGKLDKETQIPLTVDGAAGAAIGGLGRPLKDFASDAALHGTPCVVPNGISTRSDWDDIDDFVKTIRPARAIRFPEAGTSVAAGRDVFMNLGCAKCHGGAGWTLSKRFYTPTPARNTALTSDVFTKPGSWVDTWSYGSPTTQVGNQVIVAPLVTDMTGPAEPAALAPAQLRCSLRNVGTFGIRGKIAETDALEKTAAPRGNPATDRAEGRAGYNIPSLYGMALGAPYLHHGQAATLEALFTDDKWDLHTRAGAANPANETQRKNLITFILSIDADTPEFAIPTDGNPSVSHDGCPSQ